MHIVVEREKRIQYRLVLGANERAQRRDSAATFDEVATACQHLAGNLQHLGLLALCVVV
jgi:hypothetical protein